MNLFQLVPPVLPVVPGAAVGAALPLDGAAGAVGEHAARMPTLIAATAAHVPPTTNVRRVSLRVVLAALVTLGVALGVLIVYFWPDISRVVPGID